MKRYRLSRNMRMVPVAELDPNDQAAIEAAPGDVSLTLVGSRARSRIVSSEGAELLARFTKARSIPEVVLEFASKRNVGPQRILTEAVPFLEDMIKNGWMQDESAPEVHAAVPILQPAMKLGLWDVLQTLQVLDDTEVSKVRHANGRLGAAKLLRDQKSKRCDRMFERERAILEFLPVAPGWPELLWHGDYNGFKTLIISWAEGCISATAFARYRILPLETRKRKTAFVLCSIVRAYRDLHSSGVLHGDVHPGNIIISSSGVAQIVDFGYSRVVNTNHILSDAPRASIEFFEDPEFAAARVKRKKKEPISFASEQYSIGAMLYFLTVGRHYIRFSFEKLAQTRQIIEEEPLALSDQNGLEWPELEQVLFRMLSKDPEARYPNLDQCLLDLEQVRSMTTLPPPVTSLKTERRKVLSLDGALADLKRMRVSDVALGAPSATLTFGAAGIAYALLRAAELTSDCELLAKADAFAARALSESGEKCGTESNELGIVPDLFGPNSLHHGLPGIHYVQTLISHGMVDLNSRDRAIANFIESIKPEAGFDQSFGRAGLLVAASIMHRATASASLQGVLQRLIVQAPTQLDQESLEENVPFIGFAHGLSGIIYSLLFCHSLCTNEQQKWAKDQLVGLLHQALMEEDRLCWTRKFKDRRIYRSGLTSWCNGTAGHLLTLCLAARVCGDEEFKMAAISAGHHVISTGTDSPDLCCGLAGRALALCDLFRLTKDEYWLYQAQRLSARATEIRGEGPRFSLMKGRLGIELSALEIAHPESAVFPFIQSAWAVI